VWVRQASEERAQTNVEESWGGWGIGVRCVARVDVGHGSVCR